MRIFALLLLLCSLSSYRFEEQKWVLVIHSKSGEIANETLYLARENHLVAAFTADGGRETRAMALPALLKQWNTIFENTPPNAVLVFHNAKGEFTEHLVILQPPKVIGGRLAFRIVEFGEPISGKFGESVLFIDANLPIHEGERANIDVGVEPFEPTTP